MCPLSNRVYLLQRGRPGRAQEAFDRETIVAEVQPPARPNKGRVSQRGDKAHWGRQCGNVVSDAAL